MKNLIIALLLVTSNAIAQKFATPEERKIVNDFLAKSIGTQVGDGVCRSLIDSAVAQYSGVRNMTELIYDNKLKDYTMQDSDSLKNLDIILFFNLGLDGKTINHIAFARRNLGDGVIRVTDQNPHFVSITDDDLKKYERIGIDPKESFFMFIKLPTKSELIKMSKKYLLAKK